MTLILTSPPSVEPLTLSEAKAHLRVDGSDEDTLISSLITAARVQVETTIRRAMITQAWTYALDEWPSQGIVELPLSPLISLGGIEIYDADGVPETLDPAAYEIDKSSTPPRILRKRGFTWARPGLLAGGIHIDMSVGHGPATTDVPEPLRQAVRLMVADWYEHRQPVAFSGEGSIIPDNAMSLLAAYRVARL